MLTKRLKKQLQVFNLELRYSQIGPNHKGFIFNSMISVTYTIHLIRCTFSAQSDTYGRTRIAIFPEDKTCLNIKISATKLLPELSNNSILSTFIEAQHKSQQTNRI